MPDTAQITDADSNAERSVSEDYSRVLNPARVAGLYPRKGAIMEGSDADLVIFDPQRAWTLTTAALHGNADYTCYEGMKVVGRVERVLLRGRTIVREGEFVGARGDGQYLRRGKSSLA